MTAPTVPFSSIIGQFWNNRTGPKSAPKKYLNYDSRTRQFSCTTAKTCSALTILTALEREIRTMSYSQISVEKHAVRIIKDGYIAKNKQRYFPWIHKCYKTCLNKLGFKTTKQLIKEKVTSIKQHIQSVKPPLPPLSVATTPDEHDLLATLHNNGG